MSNHQPTPPRSRRSAPSVAPRVSVSGHVYDVMTGLVETVVPAGREPNERRLAEERVRA